MCPNSVSAPVAKTTARAVPEATLVPAKTRLRAWMRGTSSSIGTDWRRTGSDSPVSAASFVASSAAAIRRQSAEIASPSASSTTSPGTRSAASTSAGAPSRSTCARAGSSRLSASAVRSARYSWTNPMIALSRTTA